MKARLIATAMGALIAGTLSAAAQNPPGSDQQDRGIREDLNRPQLGGGTNPGTIQQNRGPSGTVGSGVGQGQRGPQGDPLPPGGAYQSEKNNESLGKPPEGGR